MGDRDDELARLIDELRAVTARAKALAAENAGAVIHAQARAKLWKRAAKRFWERGRM